MTPFQRATIRGDGPAEADVEAIMKATGLDRESVEQVIADVANDDIWINDRYQVNVRPAGDFIHLSIKRRDKEPVHDWRDLQQIKNELVGPEHEALELYPAESRLVDTANQYHLWVLRVPAPMGMIPVGWTQRLVMDHTPGGNTKQRNRAPTTKGS